MSDVRRPGRTREKRPNDGKMAVSTGPLSLSLSLLLCSECANGTLQLGDPKAPFAGISRSFELKSSFAQLVEKNAVLMAEVKKEKKRSLVGKAWGALELASVADLAPGSPIQVRLSSKPIDFKTFKAKTTVVKGSSPNLQIKLT